jgi:sensor histidine kinase regulating citrate/malate metabolism
MTKPGPPVDGWSKSNFWPPGDVGDSDALCADLLGILETVEFPVVVLDSNFRIASFNRAASKSLMLTRAHIGQPPRVIRVLTDLTDLEKLCAQAIADGTPYRHEVRHADGWFLLRIAPYARSGQETTGAVLTLTNVTAFRASIEQAVYEREYTKTILNAVSDP